MRRRATRDYSHFNAESFKDLTGQDIDPGVYTKTGEEYPRKIGYTPGYEELARIVAGLSKDVKRINSAVTLRGAKEYASKRKNWSAHEADITGPRGVPDGIKEVFVTDAKGNIKVINGFGLKKTDYPKRKAYRTFKEEHPDEINPETGRPYTLGEFKKFLKKLSEEFEDGRPVYKHNMSNLGGRGEFRNIQPDVTTISVRDIYKQLLFKPQYDTFKEYIKSLEIEPLIKAHLHNNAFNECYNLHINSEAIARVTGVNPNMLDEKEIEKAKRDKLYKGHCQDVITEIFSDENKFNMCDADIPAIICKHLDIVLNQPDGTSYNNINRIRMGQIPSRGSPIRPTSIEEPPTRRGSPTRTPPRSHHGGGLMYSASGGFPFRDHAAPTGAPIYIPSIEEQPEPYVDRPLMFVEEEE